MLNPIVRWVYFEPCTGKYKNVIVYRNGNFAEAGGVCNSWQSFLSSFEGCLGVWGHGSWLNTVFSTAQLWQAY